jgi:hypothetical protein
MKKLIAVGILTARGMIASLAILRRCDMKKWIAGIAAAVLMAAPAYASV